MTARQAWLSKKAPKPPRSKQGGRRVFRVRCNMRGMNGADLGIQVVSVTAVNKEDAFNQARKRRLEASCLMQVGASQINPRVSTIRIRRRNR